MNSKNFLPVLCVWLPMVSYRCAVGCEKLRRLWVKVSWGKSLDVRTVLN